MKLFLKVIARILLLRAFYVLVEKTLLHAPLNERDLWVATLFKNRFEFCERIWGSGSYDVPELAPADILDDAEIIINNGD